MNMKTLDDSSRHNTSGVLDLQAKRSSLVLDGKPGFLQSIGEHYA
ncbi:MAG: hypothetical protein OXE78_08475 [Gammaproteobacteria bacterium]|nr:hypothetical protein [Gammaproteobacteria bacterium]MCY4358021.1 hypothetical protein [Gammaproteobacteria bacterium]